MDSIYETVRVFLLSIPLSVAHVVIGFLMDTGVGEIIRIYAKKALANSLWILSDK